MNKNSSVLLIVEGAKTEIKLVDKLFESYNIEVSEKQIYAYNTNIYDVYDRVFKDSLEELDDLDFLLALKEKGLNREQSDILLSREYSDIILVFDYEPQDNRFDINKISLMMQYFSESTDKGKLYINYPSIESYKHIKSVPDSSYIDRFYKLDELIIDGRSGYKEIVGKESIIQDIRKYDRDIFNYIIKENITKAEYIKTKKVSLDLIESFTSIDGNELLAIINQQFLEQEIIPVLNTFLFFICDYDIHLIL